MTTQKPWDGIPVTGPLIRVNAAAEYVGYSVTQFYELVKQGVLPKPLHLGNSQRAAGVPKPWLDAVIAARAAA